MQVVIDRQGTARCLYGEEIDLTALGQITIRRVSHVEPNDKGEWRADLAPVGGPCLGPFDRRRLALAAEQEWLERHYLPVTIPDFGKKGGADHGNLRGGHDQQRPAGE